MHPNPTFRKTPQTRNLDYARERGFGVLSVNHEAGPLMAHVPFLLAEDGASADLHLVRSNPILRLLEANQPAVIAVNGPDGYVSPDWYGVADQVPTWNYVAVHLRGPLERLPLEAIRDVIDRTTAHFEADLTPKPPWTSGKMTPDVLDKMMRQIVPCRLRITQVDGTWKLNQNKPDPVREAAADHMAAVGIGQETRLLSALMRGPFKDG